VPDQKDEPIFKQIKSTLINALIILFVAPLSVLGLTYLTGELHTWSDLPKALDHAFFASVLLTFGWIGMKSPLGIRARTLIQSLRTEEDGVKKELNVSIPEPAADSDKTRTTTIEPETQKVTIVDKPTPTLDAGPPKEKP
jgi:hypothetical protein